MGSPLISVVIPVGARHAEHCRTAAASVQWQSIGADKFETVLIADGGAELGEIPGCTVLPSTGERLGPAKTRNRGIERAKGKFLIFLDADDYLLPRGAEHLLRHYGRGEYGYVYGDCYTLEPWHLADQLRGQSFVTIDEQRQLIYAQRGAPDYVQANQARYNIHVVTALVPTAHVWQVGGFDETIEAWEDWTLWLRLAIAGVCGDRVPLPVFAYRVYEGDRMTNFFRDRSTMEPIYRRYRDERGEINMSSCCGGDNELAKAARQAAAQAPEPEAQPMSGGLVRVEYIGDEPGPIPFDIGRGDPIRLGRRGNYRYKDVAPEVAAWLRERVPIRIVPKIDPPVPPPDPLAAQAAETAQEAPAALKPADAPVALRPAQQPAQRGRPAGRKLG